MWNGGYSIAIDRADSCVSVVLLVDGRGVLFDVGEDLCDV